MFGKKIPKPMYDDLLASNFRLVHERAMNIAQLAQALGLYKHPEIPWGDTPFPLVLRKVQYFVDTNVSMTGLLETSRAYASVLEARIRVLEENQKKRKKKLRP